ncbi:MAG: hypothetical protein J5758_05855 [Abditibacteriota bacterium]|nr:hypothetical protein [Abditibacteriota bacterium]
MKLSDIASLATRLFCIFSFIEVVKQLLDTVIFVGSVRLSALLAPIGLNIVECVLLILLFIYSPALGKYIAGSKSEQTLSDRLMSAYTARLALFITGIIIIYSSLTSVFRHIANSLTGEMLYSAHSVVSSGSTEFFAAFLFVVLGAAFIFTAVRIGGDK